MALSAALFVATGLAQTLIVQSLLYSGGGDRRTLLLALPNYVGITLVAVAGGPAFRALDGLGVWCGTPRAGAAPAGGAPAAAVAAGGGGGGGEESASLAVVAAALAAAAGWAPRLWPPRLRGRRPRRPQRQLPPQPPATGCTLWRTARHPPPPCGARPGTPPPSTPSAADSFCSLSMSVEALWRASAALPLPVQGCTRSFFRVAPL